MTTHEGKEPPAYPIGSVDKALRLLVLVAQHPAGIRIADAAEAVGAAPSTAHRLLQMLVHHGFAEQNPQNKTYHAGEGIARLGDRRETARQVARPILGRIVDAFRETVHLSVLDGSNALTLISVESPHLLRVGDRTGHTQPAARSGMGRVLLMGLPEDRLEEILLESNTEQDSVKEDLKKLSADGYILQHGRIETGVSALAVPVHGSTANVEFALGATFPTGRLGDEQISQLVDQMKRAASDLEDELWRS